MINSYRQKLATLQAAGLSRQPEIVERRDGAQLWTQAGALIDFCSNNYLGLADHPALKTAAAQALESYGLGSGAASLISGYFPPQAALTEALQDFFEVEAALVFNSGYHANIGAIPALAAPEGAIFSDALNHASIIDGCRLASCPTYVYPHGDVAALEALLVAHPTSGPRWILSETVFSMDGDLAPLHALADLAIRYQTGLYLDEAHAVGVFGAHGQGLWSELAPLRVPELLRMGTLGKAFGSYGTFALGNKDLIQYLQQRARSFIFTTALPPAVMAASLAALEIVVQEPERQQQLHENMRLFAQSLECVVSSPIVPWLIPGNAAVLGAAEQLQQQGFFVRGIRSPTVAPGTERLRITINATQPPESLRALALALKTLAPRPKSP